MATADTFTSYSTVAGLFSAKPGWVPPEDQERVQSYNEYDKLYWNHNKNLQLIMRGTDDVNPIFVPEARTIIEATHRYVGAGMQFRVSEGVGTPNSIALATAFLAALWRREAFYGKYNDNKRFGLVRGDWCWHVTANDLKPAGSRLRIMPVHPGNYFPVFESDVVEGGDPDKIVKVHIAEETVMDQKVFVKRQTYERDDAGTIISSAAVFEPDKWTAADASPTTVLLNPTPLHPLIKAFPVYHVRNRTEPLNPWGSSELRGLERILAGLTQAVSDEDMALALEGLGVYYTESSATFRDPSGAAVEAQLYPGMIMRGAKLQRVQGIGSVSPYTDHITQLINFIRESSGTPNVAVGKVDVQTAESGIALALQLGPMLAKAGEADQKIADTHTQFVYDLVQGWIPAYEGVNFTDVEVLPVFGPKIPPNVAATTTMASNLVVAGIMSKETAREWLAAQGVPFAEDEAARLAAEQDAEAAEAVGGAGSAGEDAQFDAEASAEEGEDA